MRYGVAVVVGIAMTACARAPQDMRGADDSRTEIRYWEQAKPFMDEHQAALTAQLERQELLLKRNEAIAERWEKIQARHEKLLTYLERQYRMD